jgi:hypothetical protein
MLPSVDFLLGLLFSPEDGGDMLLQNVKTLCKLHSITTQKARHALHRTTFDYHQLEHKLEM